MDIEDLAGVSRGRRSQVQSNIRPKAKKHRWQEDIVGFEGFFPVEVNHTIPAAFRVLRCSSHNVAQIIWTKSVIFKGQSENDFLPIG